MLDDNLIFGKRKRLLDFFIENKAAVDYKNIEVLKRFISSEGKILPCRRSGLVAKNQRKITKAIKRARAINLLPFVCDDF